MTSPYGYHTSSVICLVEPNLIHKVTLWKIYISFNHEWTKIPSSIEIS